MYIKYISEFAIHHSKPLIRYTWRCSSTFMIPTCIALHPDEVRHWSYATVWRAISMNAICTTLLPLWNAPGFVRSLLRSQRHVEVPDGRLWGDGHCDSCFDSQLL